MKKGLTEIIVILDRSGSMQGGVNDTIGGFNSFLKSQQEAPGTANLTLVQFDTYFDTVVAASDVRHVAPLDRSTYQPRGNTALLDAMGITITETGHRFAKMAEGSRPEKVVVVIITDGEENASHKFTREKVFEMVKHQQDVYKWEFVYLGANQDAIQVGANIGFKAVNSMGFHDGPIGTAAMYCSAASNLTSYRSGLKSDMSFEADDYNKQKEAGA